MIDTCNYRRNFIKKIYRIMKNKESYNNFKEIKERAMKDCEKYFNS